MTPNAGGRGEANRWSALALLLLLIFGILFALVTPPFQAPDEPQHFFRAFLVSEGRFLPVGRDGSSGDWLPYSLPHLAGQLSERVPFHPERRVDTRAIRGAFGVRLDSRNRIFVPFMTSAYSVVPYLPAALGIAAARLLTDSVLLLLYAGRLASVAVSAALFAWAIRAAPLCRPVFFLLALTPTAVFLAASVSADAFTNGFCFLLTAAALRLALGGRSTWTRRNFGLWLLLTAILGLTKPGYVLLSALAFLVPAEALGSRRRRNAWAALSIAACGATMAAWTLAIRDIYPPLSRGTPFAPARQLQSIAGHPLDFAGLLLAQLAREATALADQYIGKLGWIDTRLPPPLIAAILLGIVVAALTGGQGPAFLSTSQRRLLTCVLVASLVWIATLLYVIWTPYGSRAIGSLQGRYFIPLGPVAFLIFSNRRWRIDWERWRAQSAIWAALSLCIALSAVVARFYLSISERTGKS
ncbi:MAG: DUF2142 domain-containing protein [Acidobacteriota bacterium]